MKSLNAVMLSVLAVGCFLLCAYAYETHPNRPCLPRYPGTGTGVCAPVGCHTVAKDDIYARADGINYTKCGSTEYFLDCVEKPSPNPPCLQWRFYNSPDNCRDDVDCIATTLTYSPEPGCVEQL